MKSAADNANLEAPRKRSSGFKSWAKRFSFNSSGTEYPKAERDPETASPLLPQSQASSATSQLGKKLQGNNSQSILLLSTGLQSGESLQNNLDQGTGASLSHIFEAAPERPSVSFAKDLAEGELQSQHMPRNFGLPIQ